MQTVTSRGRHLLLLLLLEVGGAGQEVLRQLVVVSWRRVPGPGLRVRGHGTILRTGGHVGGPVGLLAGVVAVGGVPAAVEDGLLAAHGAPLLLLGLGYRL